MEFHLAAWIREIRGFGIPVHTWMVKDEGESILEAMFPKANFRFSNTWLQAFFIRKKFSLRKFTVKKRALQKPEELCNEIMNFHLTTRVFQHSQMKDPIFGYTSPTAVFNRDEVP